jgi:hypothetical protein
MKLIESKTIGTAVATVSFDSIPQTYTDLVLMASVRSGRTATFGYIKGFINNTTTNQSVRRIQAETPAVASQTETNQWIYVDGAGVSTSNTFTSVNLYVPNYAGATAKSFSVEAVSENNGTSAWQVLTAGLWNSTAAITSIQLTDPDSTFVVGSVLSLYGITKGSDGIVTTS